MKKDNVIFFIILLSFLLVFFICNINSTDIIASTISIIITILVFLVTIRKYDKIKNILFIALALRIIMALCYTYIGEYDPDGYQVTAENFMKMDFFEYVRNFQTGAYLYSWIIAGIWKITGVSVISIRILNALISYICCIITFNLSKKIFNNEQQTIKMLNVSAIFPNVIRYSAPFASRETIFIFILLLAINALFNYIKENKLKHLIYFFVLDILGVFIHISAAALFLVLILFALKNSKTKKGFIKAFMLAILIIFGVFFMVHNGIGTEKLYLNKGNIDTNKIAWIQEASADGRAAYLKGFSSSNLFITILQIPIRMIYFLYTPFIWMVRKPVDLLGLLDAILYIWITYKDIKFVKNSEKENNLNILFVRYLFYSLICMIVAFSIGTSNYGTAIRHRAKLALPFLILATPNFKIKKEVNL